MVVDGLLHGLALLERLHLLVHEIEVVGERVQRRDGLLLAAVSVQRVVVIQADHRGGVADQRVGVWVPAPGWRRRASEHRRQPAHERRLPAPRISSQPDHHSLFIRRPAHHHSPPRHTQRRRHHRGRLRHHALAMEGGRQLRRPDTGRGANGLRSQALRGHSWGGSGGAGHGCHREGARERMRNGAAGAGCDNGGPHTDDDDGDGAGVSVAMEASGVAPYPCRCGSAGWAQSGTFVGAASLTSRSCYLPFPSVLHLGHLINFSSTRDVPFLFQNLAFSFKYKNFYPNT